MIRFEKDFFRRIKFSPEEIERYLLNARRDLEIAQRDKFAEVKFTYAYQSVIKSGIALIAAVGSVKIRSVPGHHVKIIEKMSEVLGDDEILVFANQMRMKRNVDLYSGGTLISKTDAQAYIEFAEVVWDRVSTTVKSRASERDTG